MLLILIQKQFFERLPQRLHRDTSFPPAFLNAAITASTSFSSVNFDSQSRRRSIQREVVDASQVLPERGIRQFR